MTSMIVGMNGWRSVVRGVGSYLPERCVTNAELALTVDTSRTSGSSSGPGSNSAISRPKARRPRCWPRTRAREALKAAQRSASDIDLIIVATATPDYTFPATATQVQAALGLTAGVAFDLQAVCSGFVFALATADKFLRSGSHRCALIIGAETFSRLLDWQDRTTCVLFGDGAGAVILEAEQGGEPLDKGGVVTTHLRSDGRHRPKLFVDGGPSSTRSTGHLRMEGREVFRHAVGMVTDVVTDAFAAAGVGPSDIDWFVPHQANQRIIDASAVKLGIAPEKVVSTVRLHANTSAASIPLALSTATRDGRIKPGDLVMLEAMGGGFTWGSALVRW